jgi:hypothetical protein
MAVLAPSALSTYQTTEEIVAVPTNLDQSTL